MSDEVRINGKLFSWSSTSFKLNGEPYWGITEITFADKRDRPKGYGLGRSHKPRGKAKGKYEADNLKLKVHKDTAEAIRQDLAKQSPDGVSWGEVKVPAVLQFTEDDKIVTVEFEDCEPASNGEGNSEGPDPLYEDMEFCITGIKRNGLTLYDSRVA
jgi:hypothetical protein